MAMFALDAPSQTPSAPSSTLQQDTAPATTPPSGGRNPSTGSNSSSGGSNSSTGSNSASNDDLNELLRQSPFGRLSEVLGDDLSTIFEGLGAPGGDNGNPFGNAPGGNGTSSNLPYGGNPFAGDNFTTIFGGGNTSSSGNSSGGNSPSGGSNPFAGGSSSESSGEIPFPYNAILQEAGVNPKEAQQKLAQGGTPFSSNQTQKPQGGNASSRGGNSPWSHDFGSNSPSIRDNSSSDSTTRGSGNNPFPGGDASGIPTDTNNVPFGGTSPGGDDAPKGSEPYAVGTNLTLETTIVTDNKEEIEQLLNRLQVVGTNTTLKTTILTDPSSNGQSPSDSSGQVIGSNISTFTGGGSPFGNGQASQEPPFPFNLMTQQSSTQNQQESFPFNLINQAAKELGKDGKGGSDNETLGNGNWYFGAENQTLGNGNWHFGSDNTVTGNGNWVFGDGNTVIGNGNWYLDGKPIAKPGSGGQVPQAVPEPSSVLGILASSALGITSWLKRKRKGLVGVTYRKSC